MASFGVFLPIQIEVIYSLVIQLISLYFILSLSEIMHLRKSSFKRKSLKIREEKKKNTELTRCKLGVVHLPVVGAAALVQPCVRGRAAIAQRAGAAAHGGVHGVKVLRTLETLVIIPISVQPAVAVLPLCVRYPQIPG